MSKEEQLQNPQAEEPQDQRRLRDELAAHKEDEEERLEREVWERAVAEVQWKD